MANFCGSCGKAINLGGNFCDACGAPLNNTQPQQRPVYQQPHQQQSHSYQPPPPQPGQAAQQLLKSLNTRLTLTATFWIVAASVQFLIGIIFLIAGIAMMASPWQDTQIGGVIFAIVSVVLLIVATLNLILGISDFKFKTKIRTAPVGIVRRYEPLGGKVGLIVYAAFFGGYFGLASAIINVVTRSFVLDNRQQFLELENQVRQ
ncbi:MAG: zinc ribbon domain-containing protein [Oscillospiraceae bacterium]|nr:zinc ribbon domain-containing protein [Oscillospiraceae bacterium]